VSWDLTSALQVEIFLHEGVFQAPEALDSDIGGLGFVFRNLLFHEHQFAVLDLQVFDVVGQLQLIVLLGKFFLEGVIDQRYRHAEIAQLDLGGFEGGVAVFGAEVSSEGEVHVFPGDLSEKLPAHDVAIHRNLIILDIGNRARKFRSAGGRGRGR